MKKFFSIALLALSVSVSAISCTKDSDLGSNDTTNTGPHHVATEFVGKWMWTSGSSGAYYDDNGVYQGAAYGFATQYVIKANGSGTRFDHIFSSLGGNTGLEVNISYNGFFESDEEGRLGFFPTSGHYKSTSGTDRKLRADELWNSATKSGRSFIEENVVFTTQGGRACFQVGPSGQAETFFKVP